MKPISGQITHALRDLELLAAIYRHRGQIEYAVRMTERRLSIQEAAYGPSHVYVVTALMELATLHENLRQFAQAETTYLRLLALLEQHPGTLEESGLVHLLIMMGDMYAQQRATEKLFPFYERAASLLEQEYGPAHSDLVEVLGKMAMVAHFEGQIEQAETYLRKSIDGYERVYGPQHPQVAEVLEQVAKVYQTLGQFEQAEALLQRALAMTRNTSGQTHPQEAHRLSLLAHLYEDQGNLEQACLFARGALTIWESDTTNPRAIIHGRNHLAGLYWNQGNHEKGALLYRSIYALMGELPTLSNLDLLPVFENLARFSLDLHEYAYAQTIYQQILKQIEAKHGQNHFLLVPTLNSLALSYILQRKYTVAEPFAKRALVLTEEWFDAHHPSVINALTNYRDLLVRLGRKSEVKKMNARLKTAHKRS